MKKTPTQRRLLCSLNGQNPGRVQAGLILFVLLLVSTRWAVAQNMAQP